MNIDKIINKIISDIKDRKGIGDEWNDIDNDIKNEIKTEWKNIIKKELNKG